jgi:hypothetical protein
MAIYFFHLRDGGDLLLDAEGRRLEDIEAVARAALTEARALIAHEALTGQIGLGQRIEVEDDGGQVIHRLAFEDAVEIRSPTRVV